jgi:hypothetical protein
MTRDKGPTPLVYPELPKYLKERRPSSVLRLFGPGAIIASVTIGSGETLFASRAGAIFGYSLITFITVCAVCKLVQVYSGARYLVLTGEHPVAAWARIPGPRGWFPAVLGLLSIGCMPFWMGGLSMMLGTALNWIFGLDTGAEGQQWLFAQGFATVVLSLAIVLTLIQSYRFFEKAQTFIVGILLAAVFAALLAAPVEWLQVFRNIFHVGLPAYPDWMHEKYPAVVSQEAVMYSLVIFMMAIGGGTYDYIGYLSFYREKKWGALGAGTESSATADGPMIEGSESNLETGRRWVFAATVDVFLGFTCVLAFTLIFYILGATVLHPQQSVPDKFALLTPQVEFLTQFGAGFKYLYQIGICMAFWGTIYGALEVYSRTVYECLRAVVPRAASIPYKKFRLPVCLYATIGGLVLAWTTTDPMAIVKPIGPIATITCGLWCFAMLWTDRQSLPPALRMNKTWIALTLLAGLLMTGFGIGAYF